MNAAQTAQTMSMKLTKVAQRARGDAFTRFTSLAHLVDKDRLRSAYQRARKSAAVGVDGITHRDYGDALEENLDDLHERLKSNRYRHAPIRRVHIPKGAGETRPIGIPTLEDKLVQTALRDVLEAIYEADFLDCSYGFRRGRRAHQAIASMRKTLDRGEACVVLEADIQGYFDSIDRTKLMEFLQNRIVDRSFLRLVGKCLRAGILDGEQVIEPELGTAQGSALSPMLGNIFLHHALDLWFYREVVPQLQGRAFLWRFCDDFVMAFSNLRDADKVMELLEQQMAENGLTLHPQKTRLVNLQRPPRNPPGGKGKETFDFLGFTFYWRRTRRGNWSLFLRTRTARYQRAIKSIGEYCRRHRHHRIAEQHATLVRKLRGHYNYFSVSGNFFQVARVKEALKKIWHKWLNRRSQRARLTWERFADLLRDFPLPRPRIMVPLW